MLPGCWTHHTVRKFEPPNMEVAVRFVGLPSSCEKFWRFIRFILFSVNARPQSWSGVRANSKELNSGISLPGKASSSILRLNAPLWGSLVERSSSNSG